MTKKYDTEKHDDDSGRSRGDHRKKWDRLMEWDRTCRDCGAPCGPIGLCDLCFDEIQKEMLDSDYRFGRS